MSAKDLSNYNKAKTDWNKKKSDAATSLGWFKGVKDPNFEANNPEPKPWDFPGSAEQQPQPAAAALAPQPALPSFGKVASSTGGHLANEAVIRQALQMAGGDKKSARQWLQDNGYTIPQAQ